jgi:putative aldouronate transport system substrate-binding protein
MTEEEVSIYSSIYSDIDTYTDEMRTKFIMGVEPLANYDKFVEDIKAMGLQTIIDIQQAAVDRYFNR